MLLMPWVGLRLDGLLKKLVLPGPEKLRGVGGHLVLGGRLQRVHSVLLVQQG